MKNVKVLIGNYGSGKSELALNFAIRAAARGAPGSPSRRGCAASRHRHSRRRDLRWRNRRWSLRCQTAPGRRPSGAKPMPGYIRIPERL